MLEHPEELPGLDIVCVVSLLSLLIVFPGSLCEVSILHPNAGLVVAEGNLTKQAPVPLVPEAVRVSV